MFVNHKNIFIWQLSILLFILFMTYKLSEESPEAWFSFTRDLVLFFDSMSIIISKCQLRLRSIMQSDRVLIHIKLLVSGRE